MDKNEKSGKATTEAYASKENKMSGSTNACVAADSLAMSSADTCGFIQTNQQQIVFGGGASFNRPKLTPVQPTSANENIFGQNVQSTTETRPEDNPFAAVAKSGTNVLVGLFGSSGSGANQNTIKKICLYCLFVCHEQIKYV